MGLDQFNSADSLTNVALEVLLQSLLHKVISFLLFIKAIEKQTLHGKGFCGGQRCMRSQKTHLK